MGDFPVVGRMEIDLNNCKTKSLLLPDSYFSVKNWKQDWELFLNTGFSGSWEMKDQG